MLRYKFSNQDSAAVLSDDQWAAFVSEINETGMEFDRLLSNAAGSLIDSLPQEGFDAAQVQVLLKRGVALAIASEQWIGVGVWVLGPHDDLYPKSVVDKLGFERAPVLFGYGTMDLLDGKATSVHLGDRDLTSNEQMCEHIGALLAVHGQAVIVNVDRTQAAPVLNGVLNREGCGVGLGVGDLIEKGSSHEYRESVMNNSLTLVSLTPPNGGGLVRIALVDEVIAALSENHLHFA
jgi:predicted Rossmann fold nucleotide-binding protein DprA/Smf involved in DNA uptake